MTRKHRKLSALRSDAGPLILIPLQIQRSTGQQKSRLLTKAAGVSEVIWKLFNIAPQRLSQANDAINFFAGQ